MSSVTAPAEAGEDPRARIVVRCPVHPKKALDLVQPYVDQPDHLIGRCLRCPEWHLVDLDPWTESFRVRANPKTSFAKSA